MGGGRDAAGEATGELVWRMPLRRRVRRADQGSLRRHHELRPRRKAGPITAAPFLPRFTGDVPWAHLDIAGTAWDNGRAEAAKGGSGFGVRLLVELVATLA